MSPRFGTHHENNEMASLLHQQAEVEIGLDDPKGVELERLASSLESRSDMSWPERLLQGVAWIFKRGGEHS